LLAENAVVRVDVSVRSEGQDTTNNERRADEADDTLPLDHVGAAVYVARKCGVKLTATLSISSDLGDGISNAARARHARRDPRRNGDVPVRQIFRNRPLVRPSMSSTAVRASNPALGIAGVLAFGRSLASVLLGVSA
jgi:hypothetical protein